MSTTPRRTLDDENDEDPARVFEELADDYADDDEAFSDLCSALAQSFGSDDNNS